MSSFFSLFIGKLSFFTNHWIISLFLLVNLAIGFWAHTQAKKNSFEDYALASRSLPTGVLVMTLLGTYISEIELFASGYIFHYGALDSLHLFSHVVPFFLIGTFIAPFLVYFEGCFTLGDLMGRLYGRTVHLLSGIIGCLVALLLISAYVRAIGNMSAILLGINGSFAIVCFGSVVVLYSLIGGMRSVSYSDVLQVIAALIVFSWITQVAIHKVGGLQRLWAYLSEHEPEKLLFYEHPKFVRKIKSIAFWVFSGMYVFTLPIVQRMLITHDKKQVRKMWYTSGLFYALLACMVVLIGLTAIVWKDQFRLESGPDSLLFHFVKKLFEQQKWVIKAIFIGCLSIVLSSMDSFLHAVGISLVQDIIEPIRAFSGLHPLPKQSKARYSRVGVVLIGILAVTIGFVQGEALFSRSLHQYAVLISSVIIIPLIIGILGLKTDPLSWLSFALVHAGCICTLRLVGWRAHLAHYAYYDYFLLSLPLATLAYFAAHTYRNGGIVTLKRSQQTISERLWIPSWQGTLSYLKSWFFSPLQLHKLAIRKTVSTPTQALAFSMVIFALYTFSSVMTTGSGEGGGMANFMAALHVIGITLCSGLMLEGIWPDRWKPYFSLYWFVTLFYCLPFGGTLAFLRVHEGPLNAMVWLLTFVLLSGLVDSISFAMLSLLGMGFAMGGWYLACGTLPQDLWNHTNGAAFLGVGGLFLTLLLFSRRREQHTTQRLAWNRTSSGILAHDLRSTVQMQNGIGTLLQGIFTKEKVTTNAEGEPGCWVSKKHAEFLQSSGKELVKKSNEARQDIHNFMEFMEQQIMGWLEQEKMQMGQAVKEVVKRTKDKYKERMKITLSCPKDFEVHTFSVFPNVIINLLDNASRHGKATEVEIDIDGAKRTLTLRDNGKGIAADVLPRIFDLNFSTGKQKKAHSGLGLAFIKMIVHASSGKISCHSRAGDSDSFTQFVISFPKV